MTSVACEREQKKVAHTDHSDAILTFIDGLSKRASASEELRCRIYFYSMPVGMREIEISHPQQKKSKWNLFIALQEIAIE
jgi:hypothetical protein